MFTVYGLIEGAFLTILVGGFISVIVWANYKAHIVKKSLVVLAIFTVLFLFTSVAASGEDMNWNNGYCTECGTKYQAIGKTRSGASTYYSCPNCFHESYR